MDGREVYCYALSGSAKMPREEFVAWLEVAAEEVAAELGIDLSWQVEVP